VFHAEPPVVGGTDAYGRSKAKVEVFARGLQALGAPVAITYPGMVLGPPAGDQFGEAAEGVEGVARLGYTEFAPADNARASVSSG